MTIRILGVVALLCSTLTSWAQDAGDGVQHAEKVFRWVLDNESDSLYESMSDDLRKMVQREQLKGVMAQAESLAGRYQEHGSWTSDQADSLSVYASTLTFEHAQLNFVVTFDSQWRVHGVRLLPVAEKESDQQLPPDAVELTDTVRTGPIALPCVLTMSGRTAHPPVVVMVHGSGALDRDETVMSNKTFRDLACQLAELGISSLRYDKRTFVYQQPVTSMDEETILDALSAVGLARTYFNNVFLLGHSLGAMLAPAIASRTELDGVIMMAAPARDLKDVVTEQIAYLSPQGTSAAEQEEAVEQMRRQIPHYFEPQHQVSTALSLHTPMLILQGERDYQVTMTEYRLWQEALKQSPQAELHSYPRLNHLFLEGEGPSTPQEYMKAGTIPKEVVDDIARFIKRHYTE